MVSNDEAGISAPGALDLRARIEEKLREGLQAEHVEVIDESHLHAEHAGAAAGGSHFHARVASPRFEGLGRVAAQRLVYRVLAEEMEKAIHALSIETYSSWPPA